MFVHQWSIGCGASGLWIKMASPRWAQETPTCRAEVSAVLTNESPSRFDERNNGAGGISKGANTTTTISATTPTHHLPP